MKFVTVKLSTKILVQMKTLIAFLIVLSSSLISAQDVVGTYQLHNKYEDFELKRTLTLHSDGSFEYYNYRWVKNGIPKDTHTYGRGTWKQDKKVIHFTTESSDLDEKFTLDFTGTKARFISKSPRDKSDRDIKTALSFYESELFWVTGMKLLKQ